MTSLLDPARLSTHPTWSSCGVIQNNPIYGNYVVASRSIDLGEILVEEYPISVAPYGLPQSLPFCLTCAKGSTFTLCRKCKWPICDNGTCEIDPIHADGECRTFVASGFEISPEKLSILDYSAIEVLRVLGLSTGQDPSKWARILSFESHWEKRRSSLAAAKDVQFVVNFIREKCRRGDYEEELVEKVFGICAVNAFWGNKGEERPNFSLLFDSITLLAHDCDPNAKQQIIEKELGGRLVLSIQIISSRVIKQGDLITIHYTDLADPVAKRQQFLQDNFHFTCRCGRCVRELLLEGNNNNNQLMPTVND